MKYTAKLCAAVAALAGCMAFGAHAGEPFKIGFIGSLTGPLATLSTDIKDGFDLALKQRQGKLGGAETVVLYGDDQLNPDIGKQVYERFSKSEKVDVVTGMAFSNVVMALAPTAFNDKIFFINANAGPKDLAGAGCNYYYFNPTWHTSALSEAAGSYAKRRGYKRAFLISPNYAIAREHLDGFEREYQGEIAGRALAKINQLDFSVEIGQLRAANPDVVFMALWGPMAINFLKQLQQAGLSQKVDIVAPGFAVDEDSLPALGAAALGIYNTSQWSADLDNEANKRFVEAFQQEYKRPASIYAAQGYEVGLLLDAAIRDSNGNYKDDKVFHDALMAANFDSIRGHFRFAPNQNVSQHVYLRQVVKDDSGKTTNRLAEREPVVSDQTDPYGADCKISAP